MNSVNSSRPTASNVVITIEIVFAEIDVVRQGSNNRNKKLDVPDVIPKLFASFMVAVTGIEI